MLTAAGIVIAYTVIIVAGALAVAAIYKNLGD